MQWAYIDNIMRIMSRYPSQHKTETRRRILAAAGRVMKARGMEAASVEAVMRDAGLTVGGFYAHFPSKTAMDVEIIRVMLGEFPGPWLSGLEAHSGLDWVERALGRYLNATHRDQPSGCAYPAVLSEMAGAPAEVRRAFAESFQLRLAAFKTHLPEVAGVTAHERALATMALTIGGLLLSRALRGSDLSDDMLRACRKWASPELDEPAKPKR